MVEEIAGTFCEHAIINRTKIKYQNYYGYMHGIIEFSISLFIEIHRCLVVPP